MPYLFKEVDPSDYFVATRSYFKDDFTSIAQFAILDGDLSETNMAGKPINLDLMVQSVLCNLGDYSKMVGHIGDTFSIHYFGRNPMVVNIQGFLLDSSSNYGKAQLIQLYRDVLRVKAVARSGVAPVLIFPGMIIQGAIAEMSIEETSETQTTLSVSMKMLVIRVLSIAPENTGAKSLLFDYTTGMQDKLRLASLDALEGDYSPSSSAHTSSTPAEQPQKEYKIVQPIFDFIG